MVLRSLLNTIKKYVIMWGTPKHLKENNCSQKKNRPNTGFYEKSS